MKEIKRHLVTSALPYANGPIHIGHLVGCFLPADIYVRHLKQQGKEVLFVSGTDEHGVPITLKAKNEGITPQAVVDQNYKTIKSALEDFGIGFDHFSRTTNETHHKNAKSFFKTLLDKEVFQETVTEQLYDEESKQFLADRYITGTCPNCSFEKAYGDQCENCGRSLNPTELINAKSTLSGNTPILKETKNWYLPLDSIQDEFLNDFISGNVKNWKPTVYGQCQSWLKEGLRPRAMTRDLDWGVKVPVEGEDGKVMYVWFDAPIGYISATQEYTDDWKLWWQDESTELSHFIGKDNIVFHCIIFPAMLHAHGDYILPKHVPANEFLNLEGDKISTSRNHAIWLHEYLEEFNGKTDELRYVLTSIMPETKDADFTWKDFQARVNNELVAILGNFVNRVMVLLHKYFDGNIPVAEIEHEVVLKIEEQTKSIEKLLGDFKFRDALTGYMDLARFGNTYLQEQSPWHKIKEENGESLVANCMRSCLAVVKALGEKAEVFLPDTAKKMLGLLNLQSWSGDLLHGHTLNKPSLLFEKVEDELIEQQLERLKAKPSEQDQEVVGKEYEAELDEITYNDFIKLDMRVGTIETAEKVKKADRLLKLTVNIGFETRTVVSGIAEHYNVEELPGQQVMVLINLAPRKLKGIESKGMVLMAEDRKGKLVFMSPPEGFENGSKIS